MPRYSPEAPSLDRIPLNAWIGFLYSMFFPATCLYSSCHLPIPTCIVVFTMSNGYTIDVASTPDDPPTASFWKKVTFR